MENNKADAIRIQTSVLNALEKKVLVWLAERQPRWITSDILTYIGTFGAVVIAMVCLFWIEPLGEITYSAISIVSELLVLCGAILGVKASYDIKFHKFEAELLKKADK